MIDARELRIGNLVKIYRGVDDQGANGVVCVEGIDPEGVLYGGFCWDCEVFSPIPLTEEWLERMGGKRYLIKGVVSLEDESDENEDTLYYEFGKLTVVKWGVGTPFYFSNHNLRVELKHVHQWQNLYHSLTGKELEIRPK